MCTPSAASVVEEGDFFLVPSPVSLAGSAVDANPRVGVVNVECVVLFTTPNSFLETPHDANADAIVVSVVVNARSVAVNARRR
jgi:hypothetical protein